ncbi:MAG: hypothetical protein WCB57_16090 [Pseudonocardiaceae bacterium]
MVADKYPGRPRSDDAAAQARVLAAVWCRSVGTSWTLELHKLRRGTALGPVVEWINSGLPISQPAPHALARPLLAQRGLQLFRDPSAVPGTHNRHRIGYACRNADLIKLAHLVADHAAEARMHPVVLAAQWITAGFSADAAARWMRQGVHSPQVARKS